MEGILARKTEVELIEDDASDFVPFPDGLDGFAARPGSRRAAGRGPDAAHDGKGRVVSIEPPIVHEVDEELRVAGIPPTGRETDGEPAVRVPDLVTHELPVPSIFIRRGAAALHDEVRDDTME